MIRSSIDAIQIQRLFRKKHLNYRLPFKDNWLVLNAPNGFGKTTVLKILYYYLSGQWGRLSRGDLSSISAYEQDRACSAYTLNAKKKNRRLSRAEQAVYREQPKLPPAVFDALFVHSIQQLEANPVQIANLLAEEYETNENIVYQVVKSVVQDHARVQKPPLEDIEVLFLPTYRRIEHAVKEVFPDFAKRLVARLMNNVEALQIQHDYEQGDVEKTEAQVFSEVEEYWNTHHSTSQNEHQEYQLAYQCLIGFDMQDVVDKVRAFSYLASEYDERASDRLEQLCKVCNTFFEPNKRLFYSSSSHSMGFSYQKDHKSYHLSKLSSGEKQIVALFTHLLLSKKQVFLILDEPELSLSIDWQQKMMDQFYDLRASGVLAGLIIASHSDVILKAGRSHTHELKNLRLTDAY